jgi:hypothetical protein
MKGTESTCSDCPPFGYPTETTRCDSCPRRNVQVHVGDSVLTQDLVWCECGRGISVNGKWLFCPFCGGEIDQSTYEQAAALAIARGCNRYRDMTDAEENIRLKTEIDTIKHRLTGPAEPSRVAE